MLAEIWTICSSIHFIFINKHTSPKEQHKTLPDGTISWFSQEIAIDLPNVVQQSPKCDIQ
jgi:hypothetical protein